VYPSQNVRKVLGRTGAASVIAAAALSASACNRAGRPAQVTVGQLASMLKSTDPPKLYDANGKSTRQEYGVIPGATLLPSSHDYSVDLLPQSKASPVIFYCASVWCGAAETAAGRAVQAGYHVVSVLPDGIKGWTEAGMPTEKLN
jgi:rhodanese-related sulfurtransferase